MKRTVSLVLVLVLAAVSAFAGGPARKLRAGICIPVYKEFTKFVADNVAKTLQAEGYTTEIMSCDDDAQKMVRQIQNFTVSKVDLLYVFPAGDATIFHDPIKAAKDAGIKVVVSHNNTGADSATAIVLYDDFLMGAMDSAMVKYWVEKTYPAAAPGSVKVLVLEASLIPDMVKRCAGMKLVAEKFLRKVDMKTCHFVRTPGNAKVFYKDASGKKQPVTEPTGGLVLDKDGLAVLNPFYCDKVKIIEHNNRVLFYNIDAQKAVDIVFTANGGQNRDIKAIACYSNDAAVGASEKLISMSEASLIDKDLSKLAVFSCDITDTNKKLMLQSRDNKTLIRGIMTNGDIMGTLLRALQKVARGEPTPAESWEVLSYMMPNAAYDGFDQVFYKNELPPTKVFFN